MGSSGQLGTNRERVGRERRAGAKLFFIRTVSNSSQITSLNTIDVTKPNFLA